MPFYSDTFPTDRSGTCYFDASVLDAIALAEGVTYEKIADAIGEGDRIKLVKGGDLLSDILLHKGGRTDAKRDADTLVIPVAKLVQLPGKIQDAIVRFERVPLGLNAEVPGRRPGVKRELIAGGGR